MHLRLINALFGTASGPRPPSINPSTFCIVNFRVQTGRGDGADAETVGGWVFLLSEIPLRSVSEVTSSSTSRCRTGNNAGIVNFRHMSAFDNAWCCSWKTGHDPVKSLFETFTIKSRFGVKRARPFMATPNSRWPRRDGWCCWT